VTKASRTLAPRQSIELYLSSRATGINHGWNQSRARRHHRCLRWKTRIKSLQPKTRSRQVQPNGFFRCRPNNKEKVISHSHVLQTLTASRNFRARGGKRTALRRTKSATGRSARTKLAPTHTCTKQNGINLRRNQIDPSFELTQIDWRSSAAKGNFSYQAKSVGTEHSEINSSTHD
jgi:hypothetical protein